MHDLLLEHQDNSDRADLVRYADHSGSTRRASHEDLERHVAPNWIAQDVEGADLSGVSGTPTFFINGRRHHGAYDIELCRA